MRLARCSDGYALPIKYFLSENHYGCVPVLHSKESIVRLIDRRENEGTHQIPSI